MYKAWTYLFTVKYIESKIVKAPWAQASVAFQYSLDESKHEPGNENCRQWQNHFNSMLLIQKLPNNTNPVEKKIWLNISLPLTHL